MKRYAVFSAVLIISLAVLLSSCAKKPEAELQRAQSALAAAKDAGAPDLAPGDYQAAENKLNEGKRLYDKECYEKAKPLLEEAANLADIAKQKALAGKEAGPTCACAGGTCPGGTTCPSTGTCPGGGSCSASGTCPGKGTCPSTCPCQQKPLATTAPGEKPKPGVTPSAPPEAKVGVYVVKKGDCLWRISKKTEIYSDPYMWPIIFNANKNNPVQKNRIKNPDLIYPKQEFTIPQNPSQDEINKAWKKTGKAGMMSHAAVKHVKKAEPKKEEPAAAEKPKEEPKKEVKKTKKPKKEATAEPKEESGKPN
jgi:nucleoid-associated protein YgaU